MIPCPVCLQVLDGLGGRCKVHQNWHFARLWIAGDWRTVEEIRQEAPGIPGTRLQESTAFVQSYAENRSELYLATCKEIDRVKRLLRLEPRPALDPILGPVFLGFRHFREWGDVDRARYGTSCQSYVLSALTEKRICKLDQVEGTTHLFCDVFVDDHDGPETPRTPGLQLVIGRLDGK